MKLIKQAVALALGAGLLTVGISSANATGTTMDAGCSSLNVPVLVAVCEQLVNEFDGEVGGLPVPGLPN